MLLLDTCVLIWMSDRMSRLPLSAQEILRKSENDLFASSISAFEVGTKVRQKRLELPSQPLEWFERLLEGRGIREIPVTGRIAAASAALPLHHRDPADRILVATAIEHRLAILSPDPFLRAYRGVRVEW